MKSKKDSWKVNVSEQNLTLSILKYQKKFQIDWTGTTRKFTQKKKLIEKLDISQKVLTLTERIKKKSALGKF